MRIVAEEVIDGLPPFVAQPLQLLPAADEVLFAICGGCLVVELRLEDISILQVHTPVVDGLKDGKRLDLRLGYGLTAQFDGQ